MEALPFLFSPGQNFGKWAKDCRNWLRTGATVKARAMGFFMASPPLPSALLPTCSSRILKEAIAQTRRYALIYHLFITKIADQSKYPAIISPQVPACQAQEAVEAVGRNITRTCGMDQIAIPGAPC